MELELNDWFLLVTYLALFSAFVFVFIEAIKDLLGK